MKNSTEDDNTEVCIVDIVMSLKISCHSLLVIVAGSDNIEARSIAAIVVTCRAVKVLKPQC